MIAVKIEQFNKEEIDQRKTIAAVKRILTDYGRLVNIELSENKQVDDYIKSIQSAIKKLPSDERKLIEAKYKEEMTIDQIGFINHYSRRQIFRKLNQAYVDFAICCDIVILK